MQKHSTDKYGKRLKTKQRPLTWLYLSSCSKELLFEEEKD